MNKVIVDGKTGSYNIVLINEELNKLIGYLGHTYYKKEALRIQKAIESEFNLNEFDKIKGVERAEEIIEAIENTSDIIMKTIKTIFPTFKEIKEDKTLYSSLVLNIREGEKNFKKFVLNGILNIESLDDKEKILLICRY